MRKYKLRKVIEFISKQGITQTSVNSLHFRITGVKNGIRWHSENFSVSKSTVRRALEELINTGKASSWYRYGHCYDYVRYEIEIPD